MAYIQVINYPQSGGELKEIYDHLISTRGKLADVHKIQSLNAPTILSHMNLYKDVMFGQSPLKCYQREMLAVVVSAVNQCGYCVGHHREALFHYWKDYQRIDLSHFPLPALRLLCVRFLRPGVHLYFRRFTRRLHINVFAACRR